MLKNQETEDDHDINAGAVEEYFDEIIKSIPKWSVIVMENASYHSRQIEKIVMK